MLGRLRRQDPAAARARLEAAWADEPPDSRHDFLNALNTGLSMADEPFLERALDDKSDKVRARAAWLLRGLGESRLAERMFQRLEGILKVEAVSPFPTPRLPSAFSTAAGRSGSAAASVRLTVSLLDKCTPEMTRDGIEPSRRRFFFGGDVGDKSWWVQQMLSAVPPGRWLARFNMSAEQLIAAAARSPWKSTFMSGWQQATQSHKDADWAEALLDSGALKADFPAMPNPVVALVGVMSSARREAYLRKVFANSKAPLGLDKGALVIFDACDHAWSDAFSLEVTARLAEAIRDPKTHSYWQRRRGLLSGQTPTDLAYGNTERFALSINPVLVDQVEAMLRPAAAGHTMWEQVVTQLSEVLRYRRDIRKDIQGG
jgi:hypothetical protein